MQPNKGGSYVRNKDGSLSLVERTDWTPPKSKSKSRKAADDPKTSNTRKGGN